MERDQKLYREPEKEIGFVSFGEDSDQESEVENAGTPSWKMRLRRVAESGVSFGILGLAAYGFVELTDVDDRIKGGVQRAVGYEDPRSTTPDFGEGFAGMEQYYKSLFDGEPNIEFLRRNLLTGNMEMRNSLSIYISEKQKMNPDENTKRIMREERYLVTLQGAQILQKYYEKGEWGIDVDNHTITIPGVKSFDLTDTTDLILLDQIIYHTAQSELNKGSEEGLDSLKKAEDMVWLAQSEVPLEVKSDAFIFPSNDAFITLSRFYQEVEERGYPVPDKVAFIPFSGDYAGFYIEGEAYTTGKGDEGTPVHEAAHHQSDHNERFSQKEYDERIDSVTVEIERKGHQIENSLVHVTSYPLTYMDEQVRQKEDFAVVLEHYFVDGVDFRFKLKDLARTNPYEYQVLREKYNFAKEFFGGKEFVEDGEELLPKDNDVFVISDPDGRELGILLRTNPGFDDEVDAPIVYDASEVRIMEGPVLIQNPFTNEPEKFWKVQMDHPHFEDVGMGWIREWWFGEKIESGELEKKTVGPVDK